MRRGANISQRCHSTLIFFCQYKSSPYVLNLQDMVRLSCLVEVLHWDNNMWKIRLFSVLWAVKDKPLELRVYSGLRRQAFTALALLASVFWSSTRLGILDFSADLRVLGSEYSTFRPNFRVQSLGNRLSKSLEICCASCPDYGPLWIRISSNSDKWFPSDCSRKLGRKNRQFTIPCEINW